jgi:hypothetical protein
MSDLSPEDATGSAARPEWLPDDLLNPTEFASLSIDDFSTLFYTYGIIGFFPLFFRDPTFYCVACSSP